MSLISFAISSSRNALPFAWKTCSRSISTAFDCSIFKRVDGPKTYPGPQAQLKDRPYLAGSSSPTFPDKLNGPREDFPIILQANTDSNLTTQEWADLCRQKTDIIMPEYGAVLFRGLPIQSVESFNEFYGRLGYSKLMYGGQGPREEVMPLLYEASPEPPNYSIELHHELAATKEYPLKVMLFCVTAPGEGCGGQSPICESRDVFASLDTKYLDKVREKGITMYRRKPSDKRRGVISWQNTFHTSDKAEAERIMKEKEMSWEWLEGDALNVHYTLDGFTYHPETGEEMFFNQIPVHHASFYKEHPDFEGKTLANHDYPLHTTYGDGEEFEPEFLQQIREAGWRNAVGFQWQNGDFLVLDNMSVQHSRLSFTGKRRMLFGMAGERTGEMFHGWQDSQKANRV